MTEICDLVEAALYGRLTGDAGVLAALGAGYGVYNQAVWDDAAQPAVYPWLVFNLQGGRDDSTAAKALADLHYQVKALGPEQVPVKALAAAAHAALEAQPLALSGAVNIWLRRLQPLRLAQPDGAGGYVYHAGGIYRIWLARA